MKKILIVSTSLEEQTIIEDIAQHHTPGGFAVETTASFGQDALFWSTTPPDILIVNLPEDDLLQGYFFTKLRNDVKKTQAIVFLCAQISAALMQMSTLFLKARMLKTPVGGFFLYRTIFDLSQEYKEGQQQIHPRYLTDQSIEIQSDLFPEKLKAKMKNLSLGGIYIETDGETVKLAKGHFLQVTVFLGQPQKQYHFDAKIVWSSPRELGGMGYGVAFVNKEEVYNNMLKNI